MGEPGDGEDARLHRVHRRRLRILARQVEMPRSSRAAPLSRRAKDTGTICGTLAHAGTHDGDGSRPRARRLLRPTCNRGYSTRRATCHRGIRKYWLEAWLQEIEFFFSCCVLVVVVRAHALLYI